MIQSLESLQDNPLLTQWARITTDVLGNMNQLGGLDDPDVEILFQQLEQQLSQLEFLTIQSSSVPVNSAEMAQGELANQLRHIGYAMRRRLDIWPDVYALAKQQVNPTDQLEGHQISQFLQVSRSRLNTTEIEQGWADYLLLDDAVSVFNSLNPNRVAQKTAARSVLARLYSPSLSVSQKNYLASAIDDTTVGILRGAAAESVELAELLRRIERVEWNENGASQYYLNDSYQDLIWSDEPALHRVAYQLETHYRNANFRVSVSEQLLNRMIPKMPETREPYRDNILGANIVGQNRISNQLRISLIPDPHQISMKLETFGRVKSRTTATRSGIVVENEGLSRFRIIKRLAFGQQGIFAYRPETTSQVKQRIVGLKSNLDKIPPLGWVARRIAHNKIQEQAPATQKYAQRQLEVQAEQRFDEEVDKMLDELETNLTQNLLHPLIAMDLEPDPIQISTLQDRIVMRYRLGGRDQMASSTARPRELSSALMSLQIHESAINNIVQRFGFAGEAFTTDELIQYVSNIVGPGFLDSESNNHKAAEFEFAPFDPFRIDFEEGKIAMSFNLKSFRIGNGKRWKNLNIKATYDPHVIDGFNIGMVQSDEGVRVKGRRLNVGDQLAVGLICEVFFPENFDVAIVPAKLANQLKVSAC